MSRGSKGPSLPQVPKEGGPWQLTAYRFLGQDIEMELDGKYVINLDAEIFYQQSWTEGTQITDVQLQQTINAHVVKWCKQRVINFLSYRQRTEEEIRRYLQGLPIDADCIDEVIGWLKQQGLVDDREFVVRWVQHRLATNPMGRRRLFLELRQKGVDKNLIEETLDEVSHLLDESAMALQLANKQLRKYKDADSLTVRRKLTAFLQRRGFEYSAIKHAVAEGTTGIKL